MEQVQDLFCNLIKFDRNDAVRQRQTNDDERKQEHKDHHQDRCGDAGTALFAFLPFEILFRIEGVAGVDILIIAEERIPGFRPAFLELVGSLLFGCRRRDIALLIHPRRLRCTRQWFLRLFFCSRLFFDSPSDDRFI